MTSRTNIRAKNTMIRSSVSITVLNPLSINTGMNTTLEAVQFATIVTAWTLYQLMKPTTLILSVAYLISLVL
jgi:hypothetical protein